MKPDPSFDSPLSFAVAFEGRGFQLLKDIVTAFEVIFFSVTLSWLYVSRAYLSFS